VSLETPGETLDRYVAVARRFPVRVRGRRRCPQRTDRTSVRLDAASNRSPGGQIRRGAGF
jgi:hypothetical protein